MLTRALAQEFPASQLCATLKFLVTSHDLEPHQSLEISGLDGQGLPKMTQEIRLLLGLGQACLLAVRVRCILGMDGLPHVRHCFHPKSWLLGLYILCKKASPKPVPLGVRRRIRIRPPALPPGPAFPHVGSPCSVPLAHNSHAADGPLGNR